VGRPGVVAFDGGGAGTVVADDTALVLHHGERERKVKWGRRKARRGTTSGSPSGLNLGRTGEVAACLSVAEKERGRKGKRDSDQCLFMAARWCGRDEREQGGPGWALHGGRDEEERGCPVHGRDSSGGQHRGASG
jgi:hypothetical protein